MHNVTSVTLELPFTTTLNASRDLNTFSILNKHVLYAAYFNKSNSSTGYSIYTEMLHPLHIIYSTTRSLLQPPFLFHIPGLEKHNCIWTSLLNNILLYTIANITKSAWELLYM